MRNSGKSSTNEVTANERGKRLRLALGLFYLILDVKLIHLTVVKSYNNITN